MGAGELVAILASFATIGGVAVAYAQLRAAGRTEARARELERQEADARITRIETKVDLLWEGVKRDLAAILHHPLPEYAERDRLIELFLSGEINEKQLVRFRELLRATVGDIHTVNDNPGERVAASMLLRLIESGEAQSTGSERQT